jgi:hypothetical protein
MCFPIGSFMRAPQACSYTFVVCSGLEHFEAQVCLEIAADFKHRIVLPTRRWPLLLMWMIKSQPDADCAYRRECAKDLLESSLLEIEDVPSIKLRSLFAAEFATARDRGTLDEVGLHRGPNHCSDPRYLFKTLQVRTGLVGSLAVTLVAEVGFAKLVSALP